MQDRVPLYPGRVVLTPVSGQANTYDMTRADQPTQEGTPLNKATFLKDATAALYGFGDTSVPDDVLAALGQLYRLNNNFGNEYLWAKYGPNYVETISDQKNTISGAWKGASFQYSKSVEYLNGTVKLVNPISGKIGTNWPNGYYIVFPTGNINAPVWCYDYGSTGSTCLIRYQAVTFQLKYNGLVGYLNSPDPDAYPPEVDDGYEYVPLGRLGGAGFPVDGTYTGNGASTRSVNLGFQPRAVIIMRLGYMTDGGNNSGDKRIYGGMSVTGSDAKNSEAYGIRLESYGFDVFKDTYEKTNDDGVVYNYLAFR